MIHRIGVACLLIASSGHICRADRGQQTEETPETSVLQGMNWSDQYTRLEGLDNFQPEIRVGGGRSQQCGPCIQETTEYTLRKAVEEFANSCQQTEDSKMQRICQVARNEKKFAVGVLLERLRPLQLAFSYCAGRGACREEQSLRQRDQELVQMMTQINLANLFEEVEQKSMGQLKHIPNFNVQSFQGLRPLVEEVKEAIQQGGGGGRGGSSLVNTDVIEAQCQGRRRGDDDDDSTLEMVILKKLQKKYQKKYQQNDEYEGNRGDDDFDFKKYEKKYEQRQGQQGQGYDDDDFSLLIRLQKKYESRYPNQDDVDVVAKKYQQYNPDEDEMILKKYQKKYQQYNPDEDEMVMKKYQKKYEKQNQLFRRRTPQMDEDDMILKKYQKKYQHGGFEHQQDQTEDQVDFKKYQSRQSSQGYDDDASYGHGLDEDEMAVLIHLEKKYEQGQMDSDDGFILKKLQKKYQKKYQQRQDRRLSMHGQQAGQGQEQCQCIRCIEQVDAKVMKMVAQKVRQLCQQGGNSSTSQSQQQTQQLTQSQRQASRRFCEVAEQEPELTVGFLISKVEPWKYAAGYCKAQDMCPTFGVESGSPNLTMA